MKAQKAEFERVCESMFAKTTRISPHTFSQMRKTCARYRLIYVLVAFLSIAIGLFICPVLLILSTPTPSTILTVIVTVLVLWAVAYVLLERAAPPRKNLELNQRFKGYMKVLRKSHNGINISRRCKSAEGLITRNNLKLTLMSSGMIEILRSTAEEIRDKEKVHNERTLSKLRTHFQELFSAAKACRLIPQQADWEPFFKNQTIQFSETRSMSPNQYLASFWNLEE